MAAFSGRALAAVSLFLRVLTLLLLIASLAIMATDKVYEPFVDVEDPPNFTFRDFYAYRQTRKDPSSSINFLFFCKTWSICCSICFVCTLMFFFRYVLSAAVIGCAYILLVLPFAVIHVAQGRKRRDGAMVLLIFTDAVSIMLLCVCGGG